MFRHYSRPKTQAQLDPPLSVRSCMVVDGFRQGHSSSHIDQGNKYIFTDPPRDAIELDFEVLEAGFRSVWVDI